MDNISVFVFDSYAFDKEGIDALGSIADYQALYNEHKDSIQYYDTLSKYEDAVNNSYMAADTFVKFVAKD